MIKVEKNCIALYNYNNKKEILMESKIKETLENLFNGGLQTEWGLYMLSVLVESGRMNPDEAVQILTKFTNVNFKRLNEENNIKYRDDIKYKNEKSMLCGVFLVADRIVKADPKLKDQVRTTVKTIRDNNPEIPKTEAENKFWMNLNIQPVWEKLQSKQQ